MKRSFINQHLRKSVEFFAGHQFHLPDFAHWTSGQWRARGPEASEIIECGLGWDLTDFGSGDFEKLGLILFTIRNGKAENSKTHQGKTYCEKIMIVGENQVTPWHFHWHKMEDIINRGGGELVIAVANSTPDEKLADRDVELMIDGVQKKVPARSEVVFKPGQSLSIPPYLYHAFWARQGTGPVLCGEVSKVNDDHHDNRFLEAPARFPAIDEDEEPFRLLVGDYARYYASK